MGFRHRSGAACATPSSGPASCSATALELWEGRPIGAPSNRPLRVGALETAELGIRKQRRRARYAGRRPKTFTTLLGPLTLERAYYHCDACRTGVYPRDRALGMHATSLSPGVLRLVGLAASDFSFAAASDLLWELAAVRVETKQVERCAEALGRAVAADERAVAETVPSPAPTMYLGLDGSGVPVRPAEVEGRAGKQPDGSAKTREVKLATVWTAEGRDKAGRPVRDLGSVSYNAAVESAASRDTDPQPAAFAQRVHREAIRRGFDTAAQRVVIGDGAAWIWNIAAEQFPGAIEIVDIYHAKQHLCDVAKAIYGPGTDLADRWARDCRAELDAGRLCAVVAALRIHVETTPEARKCIHYVFRNRHRMRYPQFRTRGLCVSSSVVEAGCKQIGDRLKRAGIALDRRRGPTQSSPCAAASSADASRTSGSDEPQVPPDAHLTMMSCAREAASS